LAPTCDCGVKKEEEKKGGEKRSAPFFLQLQKVDIAGGSLRPGMKEEKVNTHWHRCSHLNHLRQRGEKGDTPLIKKKIMFKKNRQSMTGSSGEKTKSRGKILRS